MKRLSRMRAVARREQIGVLLLYGLISWARAAEAALPDSNVSGTPCSVDSDADGIVDGCDPCPLLADDETEPSRDPSCYLSVSWLPPAYRRDAKGHQGLWWTAGDCAPF